MSSTRKQKWWLVQWNNSGGRDVVSSKAVGTPEPKLGSVVIIPGPEGEQQPATVVAYSRDREVLEMQIAPRIYEDPSHAGPSVPALPDIPPGRNTRAASTLQASIKFEVPPEEEGKDFSGSDSDEWEPPRGEESSEDDDEEDEEVECKKSKQDRFKRAYTNRRTSKNLKPSHRADAINKMLLNKLNNRKRTWENNSTPNVNVYTKKLQPDSTKKNANLTPTAETDKKHNINKINKLFKEMFKVINEMHSAITGTVENDSEPVENIVKKHVKPPVNVTPNLNVKQERISKQIQQETPINMEMEQNNEKEDEYLFHSDESCRSDDNVLISNKFNKVTSNENVLTDVKKNVEQQNALTKKLEWIPIGSGQTLLHRNQYRKVNWKSYTAATRTLLMALFPRKVLATHSLTGKASPAFRNRPPKMLLNPKTVSDIVIEVADRFKVRDSLVRTVITTKCADEAKMFRMREKRTTLPYQENQENVSPQIIQPDPNQTI